MATWALAWLACSGEDPKPPRGDEGDPTDEPTDDTPPTETAVPGHTAWPDDTGPTPDGPMAPAWYRMSSVYWYDFRIPAGNGRDSGGDTGPAVGWWPRYAAFSWDFGFDGDGNLVDVDAGAYGVLPPTLRVTLATWDYLYVYDGDASHTEEWCSFELPLEGAWQPEGVPGGRLWWGASWTGGPIGGNCDTPGWELDPRWWGDPRATWDGADDIGFAIGDPTPEVVSLLAADLDESLLLGGSLRFPPLLGAQPDDRVFGQAFVVDPDTMALALDGDQITPIPRDDLYPWP